MDALEKLKQWLLTWPRWSCGSMYVDYTDAAAENTGVYPCGMEELGRTEDLLGNVTLQCRYRFTIYWVTSGQHDGSLHAQWLLDFQNWVQQQSVAGLAPCFGDIPAREWVRAEKGKLQEASQTGTGVYTLMLTAEFMKQYEVKEYGEN